MKRTQARLERRRGSERARSRCRPRKLCTSLSFDAINPHFAPAMHAAGPVPFLYVPAAHSAHGPPSAPVDLRLQVQACPRLCHWCSQMLLLIQLCTSSCTVVARAIRYTDVHCPPTKALEAHTVFGGRGRAATERFSTQLRAHLSGPKMCGIGECIVYA